MIEQSIARREDRLAAIARIATALDAGCAAAAAPRQRLGQASARRGCRAPRIGVQNAAAAIAWLRTHGVSVKAETTSAFGTRYLVSDEFGTLDVPAVVAIAYRKGFAG